MGCLLLCTGVAYADVSCRTNALGKTICTDSATGTRIHERTSASGQTKYTTSSGQTIKARQSTNGITTYTDTQGNRTK